MEASSVTAHVLLNLPSRSHTGSGAPSRRQSRNFFHVGVPHGPDVLGSADVQASGKSAENGSGSFSDVIFHRPNAHRSKDPQSTRRKDKLFGLGSLFDNHDGPAIPPQPGSTTTVVESPSHSLALQRTAFLTERPSGRKLEEMKAQMLRLHRAAPHKHGGSRSSSRGSWGS